MNQLTFNLMPDKRIFSVSELTAKIRDLFSRNFTDILVQGEISNCREAQSGHARKSAACVSKLSSVP